MPRLPQINALSFWLGFIAATLFWWLAGRLKPLIPVILIWFRRLIHTIRERNLQGANDYLRKETVKRAQYWHITSPLFPLDKVILPPQLIAPPPTPEPDIVPLPEPLAGQVVPYMPDWPEVISCYGYPRLTLAEALTGGSPIAVIGRPGAGKTVCLAHLANQVARRETAAGPLMDFAPLLLHVLDLDFSTQEGKDPLSSLIKSLTSKAPVLLQPQLRRLILERFREGQALLLLDGFDELHPEQHPPVIAYLKVVLERYPQTRLAVTASPEWIDGLSEIGAVPMALSVWGPAERDTFVKRWSVAWNESIAPQFLKHAGVKPVDPELLNFWLKGERGFPSPLEWTLKVWGTYSGDLKGPTYLGAIETHLARLCHGVVTRPILEKLAYIFLNRAQGALRYGEIERILTEQSTPRSPAVLSAPETAEGVPVPSRKKSARRDMILSAGEKILEELVGAGLLIEHSGEMIRFASPVFAGVLTAFQISTADLALAAEKPYWPIYNQAIHYLAARSNEGTWIDEFIYTDSSPLMRNLQIATRWLMDAPPTAAWRPPLFRAMASLIQDESLPDGLRMRILAGFACSNDSSLQRLFRQLFTSPSNVVRRLSLLGAGAWGEQALLPDIINLLRDPQEPVRLAACMALAAIQTENAINATAEVLMNGDEPQRQAAAEALAHTPDIGQEIIQEAVGINDILTRRAAVFGLLELHNEWSMPILEKMALEDSQWVVRNAAAQALEILQEANRHIPKPLQRPWNTPWLIAFASKRGLGIAPNQPSNDLLHLALTTGTLDEQLGAMEFVKFIQDDRIILDVYTLYYSGQNAISEGALRTVWYWSISGVKLPPPHKLG
jgi:hypothetical protein